MVFPAGKLVKRLSVWRVNADDAGASLDLGEDEPLAPFLLDGAGGCFCCQVAWNDDHTIAITDDGVAGIDRDTAARDWQLEVHRMMQCHVGSGVGSAAVGR